MADDKNAIEVGGGIKGGPGATEKPNVSHIILDDHGKKNVIDTTHVNNGPAFSGKPDANYIIPDDHGKMNVIAPKHESEGPGKKD